MTDQKDQLPCAWGDRPSRSESEPWQHPISRRWAERATRAGAVIHYDTGNGTVRCGMAALPLVKVHDVGMVTCPQCRLLVSMPHVSPCASEMEAAAAANIVDHGYAPPPPREVEQPRRPQRTWVPLLAGLGIIGATAGVAALILLGVLGHGGSGPSGGGGSASSVPADVAPAGGTVADLGTSEPTPFATALTTEEPTPAPTAAPTQAPAVVVNNDASSGSYSGSRSGSYSGSAASTYPVSDPATPMPDPVGSCYLWARGSESFVMVTGPGVTASACTNLVPYLHQADYVLTTETRGGRICAVPASLIPVGAEGQVDDDGTWSTGTSQQACADLTAAVEGGS